MEAKSVAYANYWRNSLADAALGQGGLRSRNTKAFDTRPLLELETGQIGTDAAASLFKDEPPATQAIAVVIRPKVFRARREHAEQCRNGPEIVTPIIITGSLYRDGRLYPSGQPIIARDILEPIASNAFTIGALADLDAFLTKHTPPEVTCPSGDGAAHAQCWANYVAYCDQLFEHVIGRDWPSPEDPFQAADHWFLAKKPRRFEGMHRHVLALYEHLRENTPQAPLFDRYASEKIAEPTPCLPTNARFSQRLAHASDQFSLAASQRDAMIHLLATGQGEVLAINGPPGTGKTTLLLSAVATLWAKAALAGGEPPVVFAASSNNQAVTNIIDAFGANFAAGTGAFAGRWITQVKSFGAYFPSKSKQDEAGNYQTQSFFDEIQSPESVARAEKDYLQAARAAFAGANGLTVEATVAALRDALHAEAAKLSTLEDAWYAYDEARTAVLAELGDDPASVLTGRKRQQKQCAAEKQQFDDLAGQWEVYRSQESILYSLFAWLPPVADKRLRQARVFIKRAWPSGPAPESWTSLDRIEASLQAENKRLGGLLADHEQRLRRVEALIEAKRQQLELWRSALQPLDPAQDAENLTLAECDALADIRIRFKIFLLTSHYWEGRWLLDMQALAPNFEDEKKKTGRKTIAKRWRRRMMLTPCVVSTFFMLPAQLQGSRYDAGDFVDDYLYNFADWLIIDEAGQVLPEVAAASFALAKRALVIGDTQQIEPIWSIPARVDVGNLTAAKILAPADAENDYERLADLGKTAASGSVMRIAQGASPYHYDPNLARGMFLYEHRRCLNEIIDYCNVLCYQNKLRPMRAGESPAKRLLPAMGYLHIDGLCQSNAGSRENPLEAATIAAWLSAKRCELERLYDKPLVEIVAVVTPFGRQKGMIERACRANGIAVGKADDEMTVGTVHALQGAERPVVIFSSVYSKHADGGFIDRSPSMLNVAVSRAKDSFLVFGDMDVFDLTHKSRPRGLLASYLFRQPENALSFAPPKRTDLTARATEFHTLRDAREHDAFLIDTLAEANREVHIVTPWLILQRIEEIGAMEAMIAAIKRGIKISIYTDPEFNAQASDPEAKTIKYKRLMAAVEALQNKGIETVFVVRVHSKIIIGDNDLFCVGSFNWFSARRDARYARHETSLVYRGPDLASEIGTMKESLKRRAVAHG